jgi:acetolactate synthase regulatory subunit
MHTDSFTLEVSAAPDVVHRVLALCHRKQGRVVALRYEAGDRHRPGLLELTVSCGRRAPELRARLTDLVDVRSVSSRSLDLVAA